MTIDIDRQRDRLVKAHVRLMSHPETRLYGQVLMAGKSEFVDYVPTAATDGLNKYYNARFCAEQNDAQLRFLVMHENGHVFLRHLLRHKDFQTEDVECANMAADYCINGLIMSINDKSLCEPPTVPMLYDRKYNGWSFAEVYYDLRKNRQGQQSQPQGQGQQEGQGQSQDQSQGQQGRPQPGESFGKPGRPLDHHDWSQVHGMNEEQLKQVNDKIVRAIEQGSLLAGRTGQTVPRQVLEANTPRVDWRTELREFTVQHTQGRDDDLSLRRPDRRWLDMGLIVPSSIAETVGEVLFLGDTSGSISDRQAAEVVGEMASLAQSIVPERVRTLWWDHAVRSEQVFAQGEFDSISRLAKPVGGGGTRVSVCAEYVRSKGINADCAIVVTDGYTETNIDWQGMPPTIWVVTGNKDFNPPYGRVMFMD